MEIMAIFLEIEIAIFKTFKIDIPGSCELVYRTFVKQRDRVSTFAIVLISRDREIELLPPIFSSFKPD